MAVNRLLVRHVPRRVRRRVHRRHGGGARRDRGGQAGVAPGVRDFWEPFSKDLERAEKRARSRCARGSRSRPTSTCPNCGRRELVKKFGRRGPFLACPGYPECKYTRPVDDAELPVAGRGHVPAVRRGSCVARNGPLRALHLLLAAARLQVHASRSTLGIACPDVRQGRDRRAAHQARQDVLRLHPLPGVHVRGVGPAGRRRPCPECGAPFLSEKATKKRGTFLKCQQCKHEEEPDNQGGQAASA